MQNEVYESDSEDETIDEMNNHNQEFLVEDFSDDIINNNYIFDDDELNYSNDEEVTEDISHENQQFVPESMSDVDISDAFSDDVNSNFIRDLSTWALRNNVTHKTINDLLKLFLNYFPHIPLPHNARTLLKTPRKVNIINIGGGEYVHFGLKKIIEFTKNAYAKVKIPAREINLSLNVDGLPISRSSSKCLWPILVMDDGLKVVHMVGVFCGTTKPTSANEFLKPFVEEMIALTSEEFFNDIDIINMKLTKIICDAPAKSFVLYTKGHTGFSSCSKCIINGKYTNNCVCFPFTHTPDAGRTDEDFVLQTDEEYHRGRTILLDIPEIEIVKSVPLDYMHLVCLGVVRKLLLMWIKGPLKTRLGGEACNLLSRKLLALRRLNTKRIRTKAARTG